VSGDESSSSEDEGIASIAIQRPSSTPPLFTNLTDEYYSPTCLMAKGDKIYFSDDSSCSDSDEHSLESEMKKEFGITAYNIITTLTRKVDKKKRSLEAQEDLYIFEKEKNLELQGFLSKEKEMVEALTRELSLAKATIGKKNEQVSRRKFVLLNRKKNGEDDSDFIKSFSIPHVRPHCPVCSIDDG
jgi:hypothetical protein